MENAVDSGADNIVMEILEGGRDLISVTDNGKGMSSHDARMAFERHATSKLSSIDDLNNINTFGFRGEALAAISAVTQIEMKTRVENSDIGTEIIINGGEILSIKPCTTNKGTIIRAKNIFFNVPARRKFLQDSSKEEKDIREQFKRIAFVNENISFSFYSSSRLMINLRATSLLGRIVELTKDSMKNELIPINFDGGKDGLFSFKGFIGTPISAKQNKGYVYQYLFANGRYIEHKSFAYQIKFAYQDLILPNRHPHYFIYFDVPTSDIDVNVHPTKIEVRFAQDHLIGEYLRRMIREALSANAAIPVIDFDNKTNIEIPVYNPNATSHNDNIEKISIDNVNLKKDKNTRTFGSSDDFDYDWDSLSKSFNDNNYRISMDPKPQNISFDEELSFNSSCDTNIEPSDCCFIYASKYIVLSLLNGVTIINIEKGYERILYDEYYNDIEKAVSGASVQHTIDPIKLEFEYNEVEIASKVMSFLSSLGFEFSELGGGTFAMTSTPCSINPNNCVSLVKELVENLYEVDEVDILAKSYIAKLISVSEARARYKLLVRKDIDDFVSKLFRSSNPNISPSGSIIYKVLGEVELTKLFS